VRNQKYTKITPKKILKNKFDKQIESNNTHIARARVYVECFFGRLQKNFKISNFFK
jgi:hypothetical protein